jgi:3-demethoxyubiquinol 3-hydroxylase
LPETKDRPVLPDRFLVVADTALRALTGVHRATRSSPQPGPGPGETLNASDEKLAGALMRVNHVGEICAQALYSAQALATRNPTFRRHFESAAREEADHLAWTRERLDQLGARPSFLNPLWYAGSFGFGLLAASAGDAVSLGFVVETERQVEQHLESHLDRLPAADSASRALVEQMKDDESKHAAGAEELGAVALPAPVRWAMRLAARVMTTTAHYV